jgi:uncharacterized protein (DUF433 family)
MDPLSRITHDPEVLGGRPCIRGMRITVGTVVGLLASGHTPTEILQAYPYLEMEDIQAALSFPDWRSKEVEIPLLPVPDWHRDAIRERLERQAGDPEPGSSWSVVRDRIERKLRGGDE